VLWDASFLGREMGPAVIRQARARIAARASVSSNRLLSAPRVVPVGHRAEMDGARGSAWTPHLG